MPVLYSVVKLLVSFAGIIDLANFVLGVTVLSVHKHSNSKWHALANMLGHEPTQE